MNYKLNKNLVPLLNHVDGFQTAQLAILSATTATLTLKEGVSVAVDPRTIGDGKFKDVLSATVNFNDDGEVVSIANVKKAVKEARTERQGCTYLHEANR